MRLPAWPRHHQVAEVAEGQSNAEEVPVQGLASGWYVTDLHDACDRKDAKSCSRRSKDLAETDICSKTEATTGLAPATLALSVYDSRWTCLYSREPLPRTSAAFVSRAPARACSSPQRSFPKARRGGACESMSRS